MMENIQPLDLVKMLYDYAANGDVEGMIGLMAEDMVAIEPDSLPYGGRYDGHDGFRRMVAKIGDCWSSFTASEFDYIAGTDAVAALFRFQAVSRKTGYELDQRLCEVWHVANGLLVRCEVFYFDTHIIRMHC